ncbi:MAG: hypothetical protein ACQEWD_16250, partial [Bacteroidota bacterium]
DGSFDDASLLNAIYTPGTTDLSSGSVTLTLTTDDPEGPCEAASDSMDVDFFEDATADAGSDQEICIVDGTETVQLAGTIDGGATSSTWTTDGDGSFDDASKTDA